MIVCLHYCFIRHEDRIFPALCYVVFHGVSGCAIFFHIVIINGTIFGGGGELLNIKCVILFSLHLLSETFLIVGTVNYILS